jgi:CheY-like chemotaxis protein
MEVTKKILIVDDIHANIVALRMALRKFPVEIKEASSGNDALRIVLREPVDLVLMDVRMPFMDGYETAQCLSELDEYHSIPIIFITGNDNDAKRPEKFGGAHHIHKPFSEEELSQAVKEYLFGEHREVDSA